MSDGNDDTYLKDDFMLVFMLYNAKEVTDVWISFFNVPKQK